MNDLQLIKSDRFGEAECDIYSDNKEMYMTANQLGACLGYGDPVRSINKLISRNEYLKSDEFSTVVRLTTVDEKNREARIFTEDGIYEITMLSKTEKAKEFRTWVRRLIKSIRSGEAAVIKTAKLDEMKIRAAADRATAMRMNAENRRLKLLLSNPAWAGLSGIALETMGIKAVEQVTGSNLEQLIPQTEPTYSATAVGKSFGGISANRIGKTANALGIKTEEYGIWVMDKSRHSTKEVPAFRYNSKGVARLAQALGVKSYKLLCV